MFSLASGIYQSYFAPPKLSILIIGLDGAGKTSLLERVKVTDIQTQLDVTKTPASYVKGAVALGGAGRHKHAIKIEDDEYEQNQYHASQKNDRGHSQQEGGRPARLPPPLPPKLASKSRRNVEQILQDGFSGASSALVNDEANGDSEQAVHILNSVPPPPLMAADGNGEGNNGRHHNNPANLKQSTKSKDTKKPPLQKKNPTLTPVLTTPTKRSSFINLLRCPSPGRYSSATLGEEDDEEFIATNNNNAANHSDNNPAKEANEPWSTEYLANYYINYQEGEEFDVIKHTRSSNGGGVGGGGPRKKMFPMDRIRPTLGQNLAKLDLCGCKCSLFDLSGAEKMRPLWERYYRDTDAIIYVVNAAETSLSNLNESRVEFEEMITNEALAASGLPILIFANQLDVTYKEYGASLEKAVQDKKVKYGRGISWNADDEDDFVGSGTSTKTIPLTDDEEEEEDGGAGDITKRVVDFDDLVRLFGFSHMLPPSLANNGNNGGQMGNVFLFGGSAKSGEGVRAAMEYLVAQAKNYHLARNARR
mmetsp:Transcript_514/g.1043  ORF Transcript_514/g.1043 Transcript_514/m.1043 type:complete len:534 (+) Transcript_514:208-1809(+)|eukprot:CAMPEP_0183730406 /NCGR_PEP_ID=MMETSP0737-20130205/32723_1 /TAXON_ID=385413 /ORGANISM="Thalassiosira miniscula, Strain CCMP1093" /LENGTH=533 /DNA_ID=CAMNT_0025962893 /DNA_START=138 /DNA_END=1739 /DNA_ORIENTATION=+